MKITKKLYLSTLTIILIICSFENIIALNRECTSLLDKIDSRQQDFQIDPASFPAFSTIFFASQSNFILEKSEDVFNNIVAIIKFYSPKFATFLMSLPTNIKNKLLVIWNYNISARSFSSQLADLQPTIGLPALAQEASWAEDFAKAQSSVKTESVIATFTKSESELAKEKLNLANSTFQLIKALKVFAAVIANKSAEGINNITDFLLDDDITFTKKALTGVAAIIVLNLARKLAWQAIISLPELMRNYTTDMIGSVANKFKEKMRDLIGRKAKIDAKKDDKKPEKEDQVKTKEENKSTNDTGKKLILGLNRNGGIKDARLQKDVFPDLM